VKVSELESRNVIGIDLGETLQSAAKYLSDDDIGAVAVFRGLEPVGILSERDIIRAVADNADLADTEVKEYMTRSPVVVAEDANIGEAIAKMNEFGVRHILVMDGKGTAGMVSMRDVLALMGSHWPEL
jgi:CBS domain-containing protein